MKKLITIVLLLLSILSLTVTTTADLGNFNSYDSGSDFGGSYDYGGYDYGGGYSSGYGGGIYSGGYLHIGGGNYSIGAAIFTVIVILAFAYLISKKKRYTPVNHNSVSTFTVRDNTGEISNVLMKYDPAFSSEKFLSWAKEAFITLQTAWSERDFDKVRNFEKEELFNQHKRQLDEYISKGWINELSRININQAYLFKYVRDNDYEYLTVYFDTRMGDYIKDEKTGNIIKGDPTRDYYLKYLYTFMRKTGVLTDPAKSNKSVTNCPNCGAPTTVTSSGQCEYCGSVITTGEFDWVLSDITGVNERSNIGNGGVEIR